MEITKKEFCFKSGVIITFYNNYLNLKAYNYNSSINYKNLDNYTYSNVYIPRISPFGLAFRILVFGWISAFLIVLPVKDEWGAIFFTASSIEIFLTWLSITIGVVSFLICNIILFGLVFSVLLETSFLSRFIEKNFSDHKILTIIGNKSGNNIEFYANIDDLKLTQELENEIYKIKKTFDTNLKIDNKTNEGYLDELKKLGELFRDGILTQTEFDIKKQELLKQK